MEASQSQNVNGLSRSRGGQSSLIDSNLTMPSDLFTWITGFNSKVTTKGLMRTEANSGFSSSLQQLYLLVIFFFKMELGQVSLIV